MPKPQDSSSGSISCISPNSQRTWFPILLGVLIGMILCMLLANIERTSFYRLSAYILKETCPKKLFAMPAYYWIQRSVLLSLAAIGGSIGIIFSQWPKEKSFLFLMATILVIAVFSVLRGTN